MNHPVSFGDYTLLISLHDVTTAIMQQKKGTACGLVGIHMEAFLYVCHRLYVAMSMLFNLCLKCGYLPESFMHSTVSPIVKCSTGDLTDVKKLQSNCCLK